MMKRSRKSKGVSWAHGVNLCQVKLFSSEDCPSKVGLKSQDHLQAKISGMSHPYTGDDCPPGFEVTHFENQLDPSHIPLIEWSIPPKFVMSSNWCVATGEESEEGGFQNLREMRVLEAVYPRASAIPLDSTVSMDIANEAYDDSVTPLVPIIPIEEDDGGDIESDLAAVGNFLPNSVPMVTSNIQLAPGIPKSAIKISAMKKPIPAKEPDAVADVAAAGSTALTALMKINEQGSMIDTDLLLKLLNDPKMIQDLSNYTLSQTESASAQSAVTAPVSVTNPLHESVLSSMLKSDITQERPNGILSQMLNRVPSPVTTHPPQMRTSPALVVYPSSVSGPLPAPDPSKVKTPLIPNIGKFSNIGTIPPQANIVQIDSVRKEAQPLKDINYYKNLVRQHGGEQRGGSNEPNLNLGQNGNKRNHFHNMNMVHNLKGENLNAKNQIPCMYFNSSKGCRNGVQCLYKHDMSHNGRNSDVFESQSSKRVRLCGEITGNT